jgi:hypothetical protein
MQRLVIVGAVLAQFGCARSAPSATADSVLRHYAPALHLGATVAELRRVGELDLASPDHPSEANASTAFGTLGKLELRGGVDGVGLDVQMVGHSISPQDEAVTYILSWPPDSAVQAGERVRAELARLTPAPLREACDGTPDTWMERIFYWQERRGGVLLAIPFHQRFHGRIQPITRLYVYDGHHSARELVNDFRDSPCTTPQ